ncbi:flagellin-like hook-associated protein FlgL [Bacillus thermophilus]|uniref:Flagellin n=1 Tax=Siminovitchia thermophila TaxID=1245522 RepID=A0ABS2R8S1_9BACI|nr:flagellin [Siminovitchia thermophila]MBM7716047.1 flagellin-like hook-associated protein FlgL [Siminovitchia thermophila]
MYISRGYESQTKLMFNQMNMANERAFVHKSRISTGDSFKGKIDNPVDVIKASRAEAVMRGNRMAQRNIQDALSFLEMKESGLSKMDSLGQRLRELSIQYENDTLHSNDRAAIQKEAMSLLEEMDYTSKNTTFNQKNVFGEDPVYIQAGDRSGDTLTIEPLHFNEAANVLKEIANNSSEETQQSETNSSNSIKVTEKTTTITEEHNKIVVSGGFEYEQENSTEKNTSKWLSGKLGGLLGGVLGIVREAISNGEKSDWKERLSGGFEVVVESSKTTTEHTETITEYPITEQQPKEELVSDKESKNPVMDRLLSTDFIDTYILEPIAKARSGVGIQSNRFEHRLNSVIEEDDQAMNHLNRVRDTDIAKEMMEMTKQQMLASVNANMLTRAMDEHRSRIIGLIS